MPPWDKPIINAEMQEQVGIFHKYRADGRVTQDDDDEAIQIDLAAIRKYRKLNKKIAKRGR